MSSRKQNSYWEIAFHLTGVDHVSKELPTCDMEKFVNQNGEPKYPFLVSLFKLVLSISHGNSAPENGFSINKAMLDIHGYSLGESTIEALQFVKDAILKHSSILGIPITRSQLDNVKDSRKRYMADLEAQRATEKEEEAKRKELEAKKKDENMKSQEILFLTASLEQLQNSLTVVDDSVKEGNEQLKQLLTQTNCTKKDLQRAQSKIEMGLKRRAEFEEDLEV